MNKKLLASILFLGYLNSFITSYSMETPDIPPSTNPNLSILDKETQATIDKLQRKLKQANEFHKQIIAEDIKFWPESIRNILEDIQAEGCQHATFILLVGPPGSGKTTIAENIATYLDWEKLLIYPGLLKTSFQNSVYENGKNIYYLGVIT